MDNATGGEGFNTDTKGGKKRLKSNLNTVTDSDILSVVNETEGYSSGDGVENAKEEMDALMDATTVADGGVSE